MASHAINLNSAENGSETPVLDKWVVEPIMWTRTRASRLLGTAAEVGIESAHDTAGFVADHAPGTVRRIGRLFRRVLTSWSNAAPKDDSN